MVGAIFIWLFGSAIIGAIGSSRRIGFLGAFLWSLLLSPLLGLLITLFSPSLQDEKQKEKELSLQEQQAEDIKKIKQASETSSMIQQIKDAKNLRDEGIISESEFQVLKTRLLSSLVPIDASLDKSVDDPLIGKLVVNTKTDQQMRVRSRNPDGTYVCTYGGVFEDSFQEDQLIDFEIYKERLINK